VGGQVLDLQAEGRIAAKPVSSVADLEAIHRGKTGALFRSSLRLGIFAAVGETTVDAHTLTTIDAYASAFGLAFQVTDDLLDVESTAEATGKRVGKDAERGKLTYPGLLGVEASRQKARSLADDAVRAAQAFGDRGTLLARLAEFLVTRDR
jgi:geranylgeranyl diphosphate synthase, type II